MSDQLTVTVDRSTLRIEVGAIPVDTGSGGTGPDLDAIEALTGTGLLRRTGDATWTLDTATAAGLALLDDADAAAQRTTLGLVIGTHVQAYDAGLASLVAVDTAADLLAYTTGANAWAATGLTAFARTLLDDVSASAARDTLSVVEQLVANATPASSTTDNVNGISTGLVLELDAGTWMIDGILSSTSAVTTTGIQYQWQGGGGIAVVECEFSWVTYNGATAQQQASTTGLAAWSGSVNGPGATPRPTMINGIVRVTTAGTLTLWMRSEIAGSAATLVRGGVRATRLE